MFTREIAIKQAIDFVLDCFRNGMQIEKAILFGSVAKNELRDFSVIDIALISKDFTKIFQKGTINSNQQRSNHG